MRTAALCRYFFGSLITAAAVFSATAPGVHLAATASSHPSVSSFADPICPYGTNWDEVTQSCH